ncbi:FtsW/RodA/SpoVE family cell cycle protein [Bacillus massiliigorillae]|uniref:FtsW/RodA/SpoVE family cell cycle protein n=1 Tax=Bacillus massiliigorillae TaxID=1243664 RepID=UPI00039A2ECA|nr:FtsW/RodA/SpoVE family cell cycle protein [Bacillus massiliigorillae]
MKKLIRNYDVPILITVLLLCLFGLVMVYSASSIVAPSIYHFDSDFFFQKQKTSMIIGLLAMVIAMIFPYKAYRTDLFLIITTIGITLFLLLTFFLGHTSGNAQSWLMLGSRAIQPSEFAKLVIIIYLSAIFSKRQNKINKIGKAILPPIILLVMICFLIVIQPDYGTAGIIFLIALTLFVSSGMSLKTLFKLILLTAICVSVLFLFITITGNFSKVFSEERVSRFSSLSNPFIDENDSGYQLVNSYIAIGSGGIAGNGLGSSIQKYGYLPEPHTDFILAIISEELGLVGVLFTLGGLGFIVLRGLLLAGRCKDPFGSLLILGISSMIGIQTIINAGGVVGFLPITGITLPFISYGGSSLLLLLLSMGILQNVIANYNYTSRKNQNKTVKSTKIHASNQLV